jgi:hypothetical protein
VSPFDLVKVIETFVRHDRGLPLSLRQHLGTIEDLIVEKLVWDSDSPLITLLQTQQAAQKAAATTAAAAAEEEKEETGKGHDAEGSGGGGKRQKMSNAASTHDENGAAGAPGGGEKAVKSVTSTSLVFRKAHALAMNRIDKLSRQTMNLPSGVVNQIWSVVNHCLQSRWTLLRGRHIDQVREEKRRETPSCRYYPLHYPLLPFVCAVSCGIVCSVVCYMVGGVVWCFVCSSFGCVFFLHS